ncbi:alcohol dehydrogenase [Pleurostoma richardsiae]|uniref:Alcohol dehydrogenase n=1 Tax=Pleurostoma richardsiae TaxID=41990 RepID=A0AA38RTX4_9PEZI|nr:alcohol dehydrogenase [Pleurostoma richardsiae]
MPVESKQWVLSGAKGTECLALNTVEIPPLGRHDILVKFRAASLNYRDIAIALGKYPRPQKTGIVPGSDGAGEVVAVGAGVTEFQQGDRVATCFFQDWVAGRPTFKRLSTALGSEVDGVFREYGVFPAHGLVAIPPSLSWREASTLSCAALTAWACLHGERPVAPGDVVLVQGTGGVSLFGLQFAIAAGAHVIATTSSEDKAKFLKSLGAEHVINYRTEEEWGRHVRQATPGQAGCDIILDVGGSSNWAQSLKAVGAGGDIYLIGFLGGTGDTSGPTLWDTRQALCNPKSISVGNRAQFEDMNKAIEAFNIKPVIDDSVFDLDHLKEAYQYLMSASHQGKVVVDISADV